MDDQELCDGLAAGRADAFETLYDRHGARLVQAASAVMRASGSRDAEQAAEDVVYGLFAKWYAKPPRIQPTGLRAFLAQSVRNAVIDYVRRERRETGRDPRSMADAPTSDGRRRPVVPEVPGETDGERYEVFKSAMQALVPRDQGVLEMYYGRLMTPAESANELGMTLTAYKKAVHDAKVRLRAGMETVRKAGRRA